MVILVSGILILLVSSICLLFTHYVLFALSGLIAGICLVIKGKNRLIEQAVFGNLMGK